jgi:hypothetical protein
MKQRPMKTPRAYKANLEHIHEKDQKSLQYYIQNESVIEVMKQCIPSSQNTTKWYENNEEMAKWFFHGKPYPCLI